MNFWQKVEDICKYKCISRKELATASSFLVNTISNGIKQNRMLEADLALRISKVLYVPLIQKLEQIPKSTRQANELNTFFIFFRSSHHMPADLPHFYAIQRQEVASVHSK